MLILFFLILTNTYLGVCFKIFEKYGIQTYIAIVINYLVCVLVAWTILGTFPMNINIFQESWIGYAIFLGAIFIFGFTLIGETFQLFGISFTTIVQKMSLIMPVSFAILAYGESANAMKIIGVLLGLFAIILVNFPTKQTKAFTQNIQGSKILYPFLAFFFSGVVEIILFYVGVENIVVGGDIRFVTAIFGFAAIIGSLPIIYGLLRKQMKIRSKDIIAGILLGIPNFFTVYLLMKLLNEGWDGSVLFPISNISILALSAVLGIILFKENLNINKSLGLVSAIVAIILISQS